MPPSHYEVLGVAPDASPEEVRRAYHRSARTLHPDRQHGRDPAEVEVAARRMSEVNAAWRVLRDERARAAYDRRLRPRATAPGDGEGDGVGIRGGTVHGSALDGPDHGARVLRGLPWFAMAAVLLVIFVVTAYAGGRDTGPSSSWDLVGRCVANRPGAGTAEVPCDGPNQGRVQLVVGRQTLCPSGSTALPRADEWLCLEPAR